MRSSLTRHTQSSIPIALGCLGVPSPHPVLRQGKSFTYEVRKFELLHAIIIIVMYIICLHYLVEGGRKVIVEGATHTNWVSLMDRVFVNVGRHEY